VHQNVPHRQLQARGSGTAIRDSPDTPRSSDASTVTTYVAPLFSACSSSRVGGPAKR